MAKKLSFFAWRKLSGLFLFLVLLPTPIPLLADQKRSVLILDQGDITRPFLVEHTLAIRAALTDNPSQPIETYTEGLDIERFPGIEHKKRVTGWLLEKYRGQKIDAIIAEGPEALDFAINFRSLLDATRTIPIVFTAIADYSVSRMAMPPQITGVASVTSLKESLQQAVMLVPGTKRIALLGDAGSEGTYQEDIARQFPEIQFIQTVNVMTGIPVATLLSRVSSLPKDTVIFYLGITRDAGQYFQPNKLLATIAREANRPIFIMDDSFMGVGAVGGLIIKSTDGVPEVVDMVNHVINGDDASKIPILTLDSRRPTYDAKALARWQVDLNSLPEGSLLLNREPTLWERYSAQIVAIAAVIVFQAALIALLIVEYRRRRKAELRFRRTMSDFAHLSRTTALGELSSSIAHELNQPLAAILTNAEAADALLATEPPNLSEIANALADIRRDDQRASDIIASMRSMVRKDNFDLGAVDLNEAIDEILRFVSWEARTKNVQIIFERDRSLPCVAANKVQLSQVILNLLMNGVEAVQKNVNGERIVKIRIRQNKQGAVETCVEDNGPGIPPETQKHIFDPYYTTKEQGLGMGLSISRAIIEAHSGKLNVEYIPTRGACFSFALAKARPK